MSFLRHISSVFSIFIGINRENFTGKQTMEVVTDKVPEEKGQNQYYIL
jgi:hypothetical protein